MGLVICWPEAQEFFVLYPLLLEFARAPWGVLICLSILRAAPVLLAAFVFTFAAVTGRDCGRAGEQLLELVHTLRWRSRKP